MKSILLTLAILLLVSPAVRAADVVAEADVVAAPEPVPAQEFVGDAQLEMDRDAPLVGDRIEYRLSVNLPQGWSLDAPEELHFVEALRPLREEVVLRKTDTPEGTTAELTIPYVLVRAGRIKLPQRSFQATGPGGEMGVVQAGKIAFQSGSYFASENDPQPAKPFGPLPVVERNWILIWSLIALGIILVAVAMTWLVASRLRPRQAPPGPPPRPAHEVALEALAALARSNLDKEGAFALWYTELSTILRTYLGGRYGFDSMDLTTTELCLRMNAVAIAHHDYQEVALLLEELDLVKFAKAVPTQTQSASDFARVEAFVQTTMPRPEPEPAPAPQAPTAPGGEA